MPDQEMLRRLLSAMLRIRRFQERIESVYHLDEMKTPVHLCIGQEAVPVGVCDTLRPDDYINSNHRGHGHYLAKGGDLPRLVAELYCRETGCSKGHGGSMHLVDTAVGILGSSSIVGGGIPLATGLGLAIRMKSESRVSVVFFSDGAAEQGVLYESINFAVLKQLPVLFVYENNQYSVCSPISARQAWDNVFHRAPADQLFSSMIDGNDVLAVREATMTAVERARLGKGPSFLECRTYRLRGHAGAGSDLKLGYRTAEEMAAWEARCPVERLRQRLLAEDPHATTFLAETEARIAAEIEAAFRFAQESPLPAPESVGRYLFQD